MGPLPEYQRLSSSFALPAERARSAKTKGQTVLALKVPYNSTITLTARVVNR